MWLVSIVFSFCMGILAGYKLPLWHARWRAYRRRKNFRLTVLQQYMPAPGQKTGRQGKSDT